MRKDGEAIAIETSWKGITKDSVSGHRNAPRRRENMKAKFLHGIMNQLIVKLNRTEENSKNFTIKTQ
jgi:hypothetical protein